MRFSSAPWQSSSFLGQILLWRVRRGGAPERDAERRQVVDSGDHGAEGEGEDGRALRHDREHLERLGQPDAGRGAARREEECPWRMDEEDADGERRECRVEATEAGRDLLSWHAGQHGGGCANGRSHQRVCCKPWRVPRDRGEQQRARGCVVHEKDLRDANEWSQKEIKRRKRERRRIEDCELGERCIPQADHRSDGGRVKGVGESRGRPCELRLDQRGE
mmetsp:Transcript_26793/g.58832  ORF Transcript_26793/g.58832 Transcript_26793/m.58832 type:complete len:220 (-) Transcript_26793:826-1485(-)